MHASVLTSRVSRVTSRVRLLQIVLRGGFAGCSLWCTEVQFLGGVYAGLEFWLMEFAGGAQLWQLGPVCESTCTVAHSQKPYTGVPFLPYLSNHLVLSVFLILAILVGFSDNTLQ